MPVPLIIPLITAGISAYGAYQTAQAAREQREAGEERASDILTDIEAGEYDAKVSQGIIDATQESKRLAQEQLDRRLRELAQSEQSFITTTGRSGDTRLASLMPQVQAQGQKSALEATESAQNTINQANLLRAQAQQGADQSNLEFLRSVIGGQLTDATTAAGLGFAGEQQALQSLYNMPLNTTTAIIASEGIGGMSPRSSNTTGDTSNTNTNESSYFDSSLDYEGGTFGAARGMKVKKTPGEFNHDTNPLTLVDKNGADTGIELTGGELVFNPSQSKTMQKFVEKGDKAGLFRYTKKLLNRPQFK